MPAEPLDRLFERYARRGDTHALGEVYDALAPELYRLALHLARDGAEAEDLLQSTFVTAIERAQTFRSGEALKPWLCGILANHARNAARRSARTSPGEPASADAAPEPIEEASRAELDESLGRALERVPEAYRPALVLRLRHGLSVAQIAEALGSPPGTVRSQLARGTELLRRTLPAGLVGACAALLAPRASGLEGVRAAVLAHAEVLPIPFAVGGLWVMKKWIAAALVLLFLSGAAGYGIWKQKQPEVPLAVPVAEVAREAPSPEPLAVPSAREERSSVVEATPAPAPELAPSAAALEVELRYASNGEPARGVTVLLRVDQREVSYSDERCAESDADGRVRWEGLPLCGVEVHALQGGRAGGVLEAGTTLHLRLSIPDGVEVLGEVLDAALHPVPLARIWLSEPNMPALGRDGARADAQGRFRLRSVGADRWIGARSATHALSYLQRVRGASGAKQELRIVLEREGARLAGTVFDAEGKPVPHAQVLAGSEETAFDHALADGLSVPGGAPQRTEAGDDGRFELEGLPLGACTLRARAAGFAGATRTLELFPSANRCDLRLAREAQVGGIARDASGAPLAQVRISRGSFGRFECRLAISFQNGSFQMRGLEAGETRLVAELPDGRRAEGLLVLREGELCEWNPVLVLPDAILGCVRTSAGEPLAGWSVVLQDEQPTEERWQSGTTGADGRFRLRAQAGRTYRVSVFEPGRWSEFPRATLRALSPGGAELAIAIAEDGSADASLAARILDAAGEPVPDARLVLWHVEEQVWRELSPDARGDVALAHVPPGHLRIEVRSQEQAWKKLGERETRAGERLELGTIELEKGAHISGALRGAPEAACEITVADERGLLAGTVELHGGEYRSSALVPGKYTLYVRGKGVGDQRHDFELAAGRDVRLDLALEALCVRTLVLQPGERTRTSSGITCVVLDAAGRSVCMRSAPITGTASVTLELSLPAGVHRLQVFGERGSLLETEISASGAAGDPALTLTLP